MSSQVALTPLACHPRNGSRQHTMDHNRNKSLVSQAQAEADMMFEAEEARKEEERLVALTQKGATSLSEAKELLDREIRIHKGEKGLTRTMYAQFLPLFASLGMPKDRFNAYVQKAVASVVDKPRAPRKARKEGSDYEDEAVVEIPRTRPVKKPAKEEEQWRGPKVDYASTVIDLIAHGNTAVARELNYYYAKNPVEVERLVELMRQSGRQFRHGDEEYPPEGTTSLGRKLFRKISGPVPIRSRFSMENGDDLVTGKPFPGRVPVHPCLLFVAVVLDVFGFRVETKILNGTCGGLPFLITGSKNTGDVFVVDPSEKVTKFDARVSGRTLKLVKAIDVYPNIQHGVEIFKSLFATRANKWRMINMCANEVSDHTRPNYVPARLLCGRPTTMKRKMDEYFDDICNSSNYSMYVRVDVDIGRTSAYPSALFYWSEYDYISSRSAATLPTGFVFPTGSGLVDAAVMCLAGAPAHRATEFVCQEASGSYTRVSVISTPIGILPPTWWTSNVPGGFLDMNAGAFLAVICKGGSITKSNLGRISSSEKTAHDLDISVRTLLRRYAEIFPRLKDALDKYQGTAKDTPFENTVRGITSARLDEESSEGSSSSTQPSVVDTMAVSIRFRDDHGSESVIHTQVKGVHHDNAPSVPAPEVKPETPVASVKGDKAKAKAEKPAKVKADAPKKEVKKKEKSQSKPDSSPKTKVIDVAKTNDEAQPGPSQQLDNAAGVGKGNTDSAPKTEPLSRKEEPPKFEEDPPSTGEWKKIFASVLTMNLKTVSSQSGVPRGVDAMFNYSSAMAWNMCYSVHESFWYPAPDYWNKIGQPVYFNVEYATGKGEKEQRRNVVYYYALRKGKVMWSTQHHLAEYTGIWGYIPWTDFSNVSGGFNYVADNRIFAEKREIDFRQMMQVMGQAERLIEKKIPDMMHGVRDEQLDRISRSLYADMLGADNVHPYYGKMVGDGCYVMKTSGKYYYVSPKHGWRDWKPVNSGLSTWYGFDERVVAEIRIHYAGHVVHVKSVKQVSAVPRPWYELTVDTGVEICLPVENFTDLIRLSKTNAPSSNMSARILAGIDAMKLPSEYGGALNSQILTLMADMVKKETASTSDQLNRINYHSQLHSLAVQDTAQFAKWTYPYIRSNPLTVATVSVLLQILLPWLVTALLGWKGIGYGVSHHSFDKLITFADYLHVLHDASIWTLLLMTAVVVWAYIGDLVSSSSLLWTRLRRPDIVTSFTEFVAWADNLCWQAGLLARLIWIPCVLYFVFHPCIKRDDPEIVPEDFPDPDQRIEATLSTKRVQFSAWCLPNFKHSASKLREGCNIVVKNMTALGRDGVMDQAKWDRLRVARPITHPGPILHSMISGFPNFVLAQTPWNTLNALRERALRPRKTPKLQMVKGLKEMFGLLPRFTVEQATADEIEEWLSNRQPKYKAKYARAYARLKTFGFEYSRKDYEVGVFVKEETLPKLSPRIICTMSDNFNMYFGPWVSKFERLATDSVSGLGFAVFTGGLNPAQKGQWYYDNIYQENMWVLDIDASKWDASVPDEFIDMYYEYLVSSGWTDRMFLDKRRDYVIKKKFSCGAQITANMRGRFVTSGSPDTYIGNSVMNLALQMWLVSSLWGEESDIRRCRFMICGDDAIVGIPKAMFSEKSGLTIAITEWLSMTGMEFEINVIDSKDTHDFRFCSGFFAPSEDSSGRRTLTHVPEPVRFLGKSYAYRPEVMGSISLDDHRKAVNLCGFYSYNSDPVWSLVFEKSLCYSQEERVLAAMQVAVGSWKWRWLVNQMSQSVISRNWSAEAKATSWEFWGRVYPGLNATNLPELRQFVFRDELGLTKPKQYGFYCLSQHMSSVLCHGLYPVPSFFESLKSKLHAPPADGERRDSNPFAFVVVLEEMDTPANRLLRSEVENEQFRMADSRGAGREPFDAMFHYDAGSMNDAPMSKRVQYHNWWNRGTKTWTQALLDGHLDSFYMREMWKNPTLAAQAQWWQGEEVTVPILRK